MATRFVTQERLEQIVGDVDPDNLGTILADSKKVFEKIDQEPWITEASLRSWAEGQDMDVDRLNAALNLLRQSGRVSQVQLTESEIPPED